MSQTREEKNEKNREDIRKKREDPEFRKKEREKEKIRRSKPEWKSEHKKRRELPENKEKQRKKDADPERKAKQAIADASPERGVKTQIRRTKKRVIVLKHYSKKHSNSDTPCCRCCGESKHIAFLDLDHVDGKKAMESNNELVKNGYSSKMRSQKLFHWIINNDFPDGFQVLCKNCNGAKSLLGKCPHQK